MDTAASSERSARWLRQSPFDRHLWARVGDNPALAETRQRLGDKLPLGDELLGDLFTAFHRSDVRWTADDPRGSAEFHAIILERLLASPGYARLHPEVRGRDDLSLMAADALAREIAAALPDEVGDYLAAEEEYHEQRSELESAQEGLEKAIESRARPRRPRPGDSPDDPELLSQTERKERLAEIQAERDKLDREHRGDYERVRVGASLRGKVGAMQLPARVSEIAQGLEAWSRALATWGDDPADPVRLDPDRALRLFRRLREDRRLREATEKLGRFRLRAAVAHRTRLPAAPVRLAGIEAGNDLARLVPSELMLLGEPGAETEFLRRYAEQELALYRFEERGEPVRGPVVICVDESSSMAGEPEVIAKAMALALVSIAAVDSRPAALVRFSGPGSLVVEHFEVGHPDPVRVADILGSLLGGGTDFDGPLLAALEVVAEDRRYELADIVVITDGEGRIHPDTVAKVNAAREAGGARLYCICVGVDGEAFREVADRTWSYVDLATSGEHLLDELVGAVHLPPDPAP